MVPSMPPKNVLITGASSGIGYELAKLFSRDRHNCILVARSSDKLEKVATELRGHGVTVKSVALDLASAKAPQFLFDELQRQGITVHVLINNAGVGTFGEFARMQHEEILGQIDLNVTALTLLTRLFLPPMLNRHDGHIMNIASAAGFQPGPSMAVYSATKAYVISFSKAIAHELRGSGITVMCFCPGATNTEFAKRAGDEQSAIFKKAMSAKDVALDGYSALMTGSTFFTTGTHTWTVAQYIRFTRRKLVNPISRWVSRKKG